MLFWNDLPFEIIQPYKPVLKHSNAWFFLIDPKEFTIDGSIRAEVVEALLMQCNSKQLVRQLAFAKDKDGRVVKEFADQSIKDIFNKYLFFGGRYDLGELIHQSATSVVLHAVDHGVMADYEELYKEKVTAHTEVQESAQFPGSAQAFEAEMTIATFKQCIKELGLHAHDDWRDVERALEEDFCRWDKDNSGSIDMNEFVDFCKSQFGETRKVVLKFMRQEV